MGLEILNLHFQIAICTGRASNGELNQIKEAVQSTINKQIKNAKMQLKMKNTETMILHLLYEFQIKRQFK